MLAVLLGTAHAGQGIDARLASPVRGTGVELRVQATDEGIRRAVRNDPASVLRLHSSSGGAQANRISPAAPGGDGVVTIMAIDASGSFSRFLTPTYEVADAYLDRRPLRERVGVMLFGVQRTDFATQREDKSIRSELAKARRTSTKQAETRLAEFVRQAAHRAAKEQPPSKGGVRQIILFTDGGEESSTWSVDEVADELNSLDVRAHIVTFYRRGFGTRATALDNLSRLASRTGGVYVQATEARDASGRMGEITGSSADTIDIQATLCGFPAGTKSGDLRVEVWVDEQRVAWSDALELTGLSERAGERCDPNKQPPSATGGGSAQPGEPSSAGTQGTAASGKRTKKPAQTATQIAAWSCLPLGFLLLVLGLVVGVVLVARNRRDAPPPPPPKRLPRRTPAPIAPPPSPVVPPAPQPLLTPPAATPAKAKAMPSLAVIQGQGVAGKVFPFRGNVLLVGARPGNDLVVDLPTISGHHARFEIAEDGMVYVTDSDSANGTWVQGTRLNRGERRAMHPGERVALSQALVFELKAPEQGE